MARSYKEAAAGRQARLSPGARRQSQVFAGAYELAVQFIELRERRGMTQTELAVATGLNQADISRIEGGAANPTERTLLRIADALDADLRLVERPAS
jgi:DNA-binding XRE family transcriptional regulator